MRNPHLKSLTFHSLQNSTSHHHFSTSTFTDLCSQGNLKEAFNNFTSRIWSDPPLFSHLLKSCIQTQSLTQTQQLHSLIITSGSHHHKFVRNHLLNTYTKLGFLETALLVFDKMPLRNTMSCNILIGGFIQNGQLGSARSIFDQMDERNLGSWNAMITGCVQLGFNEEGLGYFLEMHKVGFFPDVFTVGSVLRGCAGLQELNKGRQVHGYVVKAGLEYNLVIGSSLAHMYIKGGSLGEGETIIRSMPVHSVPVFNTLIAGRAQNGYAEGALEKYNMMKRAGFRPDDITFVSVLSACSELATLGQGQQIHAEVTKAGVLAIIPVVSTLISMYSRSGCLDDAVRVFEERMEADIVLWSSMLAAYGFHGRGKEAIDLVTKMEQEGIEANEVTFLSLLYACSHCGLKDEGLHYFDLMVTKYKLEPQIEHYTCVVDLLGRLGCLEEAEGIIRSMPVKADAIIWKTLLSACKIHKNPDMSKRIAKEVLNLNPHDAASYVLLANIQASARRWQDMSEARKEMKDRNLKKEPGISWFELKNQVHQFTMAEKCHPQSDVIGLYLKELMAELKLSGYEPDISSVLQDMDAEEMENNLLHHSEKLAIAFALMNTPEGTTIRVMKNLRVCSDCHAAIKCISLVKKRDIVVRDASRFHHFKDGCCSCGDYW